VTTEPQKHLARRLKSRIEKSRVMAISIQSVLVQSNLPHLNLNKRRPSLLGHWPSRMLGIAAVPALIFLAGCGGSSSGTGSSSNGTFSVSPGTAAIDTNCTGCNSSTSSGAFEQFTASLNGGGSASVNWSVSGGDAVKGPGSITSNGQYTPPSYLTADSAKVTVTATLASGTGVGTKASAAVTVTPGFIQPLTPENAALGANGTVIITGYIAEGGGSTGITYTTSSGPTGSGGGQGSLGTTSCTRNANEFTHCSVTYSAPAAISATAFTYIIGTVGSSSSKTSMQVLLNTAGISSDPATHQVQLATPIMLGSSGGNNNDYDTQNNQVQDCCGGTLGALIQSSGGTQYILSCNHVLARSDQASMGEQIIQPGLIDDDCEPTNGTPPGTETPVGVLTAWLPLSSASTNVDAAIAAVDSGAVSPTGAILELGLPGAGGALAAAPPGTSCSIPSTGTTCAAGQGEVINGTTSLVVAKSGRTTGLTCGSASILSMNIQVSYFKDCAETEPYLTKIYTNQIGVEGDQFSDAGDSGSLLVDASNGEPVGLFFAGGTVPGTNEGLGIANPVSSVLSELGTQEGTSYKFVGTTDHPVSCLNYGNATATAAQATALTDGQSSLAQQALTQARMLVNPSAGILGVATGKSSDHAGEATVILYVDQNMNVNLPQMVNGVRTEVIPTTAQAVAAGVAPQAAVSATATEPSALPSLSSTVLNQAIAAKEQVAQSLMKQNPAFFGVGVGQSYDNPKEATLVILVDRTQVPATLPATINGLRTRYVIMNRLHVTRSYLGGQIRQQSHCVARPRAGQRNSSDLLGKPRLRDLNLQ
jgi:hypothetical protein